MLLDHVMDALLLVLFYIPQQQRLYPIYGWRLGRAASLVETRLLVYRLLVTDFTETIILGLFPG